MIHFIQIVSFDIVLCCCLQLSVWLICKVARSRAALLFIESYRELPMLAWPRQLLDQVCCTSLSDPIASTSLSVISICSVFARALCSTLADWLLVDIALLTRTTSTLLVCLLWTSLQNSHTVLSLHIALLCWFHTILCLLINATDSPLVTSWSTTYWPRICWTDYRIRRSDALISILVPISNSYTVTHGLTRCYCSHARMVERMIGQRVGTGGSSGVAYLDSTLNYRVFKDVWRVRTLLIKKDALFPLDTKAAKRFYDYQGDTRN